jgi:hypothetical protein
MAGKILIMGLPGAGKTTLAKVVAARLPAVHFNADEIRAEINKDLTFTIDDRIEHARRMGWLCAQVVAAGTHVVADFVCPTERTRDAFGPSFVVWVDRITAGRFEDTNKLFEPPAVCDLRVTAEGTPEYWAELVVAAVQPVFDPRKPTALFIGRYQPFHDGHKALIERGLAEVGQACIAVRDTHGTDANNPFSYALVKTKIEAGLAHHRGRVVILPMPNITAVLYGRDVGYRVERIDLDAGLQAISATEMRRRLREGVEPNSIV